MAASAMLQIGTGGVANYNQWEMVYDASTQTSMKLKYGFSLGNQAPDVLFHTPDNGSPVPVRANGANRLIFLTYDIPPQANWDTVSNIVATFARLVDGPYSQAIRAQTNGDVKPIRVALQLDGATYYTYYEVLTGFMDTSTAFTEPVAQINVMARNITLALTCAPFGYGDHFTLKNMLASSPHMLVDSNADGLADGWSNYGTPTETVISTLYLIGGYSQKVTADSGSGVATAVVTASTSTDLACYVWVYSDTMSGFQMSLRDGSNNAIQTVTCTAANADKTAVDSGGRTWYRYKAVGQNTTAANARISITSTSAGKVFYVDGAYLTTGTQTVPPAFASGYTLANNAVDWLDFWGIPGDVPALVRYRLTGTTNKSLILGKKTDGTQLATSVRHLIQDTFFANGSTWVTSTNYTRASADASVSDPYTATYSGDDGVATANAIGETIWKVYVIGRASATENGLYAQWSPDSYFYQDLDTVTPTNANTWEIWDLGIMNPIGMVVKTDPLNDIIYSTFYLRLVSVIPTSGTVDVDYVLLVPISEEYMIAEKTPGLIAGDMRTVFRYLGVTTPSYLDSWRGTLWMVAAGDRMTRIIYHDYSTLTTNAVTAGDSITVTTTVIPRTAHLLGTK